MDLLDMLNAPSEAAEAHGTEPALSSSPAGKVNEEQEQEQEQAQDSQENGGWTIAYTGTKEPARRSTVPEMRTKRPSESAPS